MTEQNYKPIGEKFLERNDLFALKWNEGLTFMQIRDWETHKVKPFDGLGDIPPESDLPGGFTRLEDEDGDDVLHVGNDNPNKVIHAGIGHKPWFLRRYTNYPESENRLRTVPNLKAPRPGSGSNYGYVDGKDSPYDTPTEAEELVIPRGVHLDFNFYNPQADDSHAPVVNVTMREYKIEALEPSENSDVVRRVMSPGSPIPTYPVGSIDSQENYNLGSDWGVEPLPVQQAQGFGRQ